MRRCCSRSRAWLPLRSCVAQADARVIHLLSRASHIRFAASMCRSSSGTEQKHAPNLIGDAQMRRQAVA
jgi:hypothetical protein